MPDTSRGFTILECSQIKDNDWKDDGFEFINKSEIVDDDLTPEEKILAEESRKKLEEVSKYMVDTVLPTKAALSESDAFIYLSNKNFVSSFIFVSLIVVLLMNLINS